MVKSRRSSPASSPAPRAELSDKLAADEELLRLATEMSGVAVWEYDVRQNRMRRTRNHDALYGVAWQEPWQRETFLGATVPADRQIAADAIDRCLAAGGANDYEFDFRVLWPDETTHWLCVRGQIIERDESGVGTKIRGVIFDVDHRKRTEERADRLSRLYGMLSACNQAIIFSQSEIELFQKVCDAAVTFCHVNAAWIGRTNSDGDLVPLTWSGDGVTEFLALRNQLAASGDSTFSDLATLAMSENRTVWRQRSTTLASDVLGQRAADMGWASAESLPLRRDDTPVGAMTLYSSDELSFDDEADRLLREVADDVSFALQQLDEGRRELKDREIEDRRDRDLREVVNRLSVGIYVVQDERCVFASDRAAQLLGFAEGADMMSQYARELIPSASQSQFDAQVAAIRADPAKRIDLTFALPTAEGHARTVRIASSPATFQGRPARYGVVMEVPPR